MNETFFNLLQHTWLSYLLLLLLLMLLLRFKIKLLDQVAMIKVYLYYLIFSFEGIKNYLNIKVFSFSSLLFFLIPLTTKFGSMSERINNNNT